MTLSDVHTCEMCGLRTSDHDLDFRFRLPGPVLNSPDRCDTEAAWLSDPDPNVVTLMQVQGISPFVRALLPVRLEGGHTLRYGVWIAIHPDDLQRAALVWNQPEHRELKLTGYLATRIEPWGVFAAPVDLAVLDPDHTPYCVSSREPKLNDVLTQEWPFPLTCP